MTNVVRTNCNWLFLSGLMMLAFFMFAQVGCKPRTTAQKVEDKMEDAKHEINQGVERAQENIEDASKDVKKKIN